MAAFWSRLLGCERKTARLLAIVRELRVQLLAAQQQLRDQRGT